jgi:hypothetical protein
MRAEETSSSDSSDSETDTETPSVQNVVVSPSPLVLDRIRKMRYLTVFPMELRSSMRKKSQELAAQSARTSSRRLLAEEEDSSSSSAESADARLEMTRTHAEEDEDDVWDTHEAKRAAQAKKAMMAKRKRELEVDEYDAEMDRGRQKKIRKQREIVDTQQKNPFQKEQDWKARFAQPTY